MKILVKEYTTNLDSQSMMLYSNIENRTKIEALFWSLGETVSVFDALDNSSPDFLILDIFQVTDEISYYMQSNSDKNIKTILHIPDDFTEFDKIINHDFIKKYVKVIITKNKELNIRGVKTVELKPCVDDNIDTIKMPNKIDVAHILSSDDDKPIISPEDVSFHALSMGGAKNVDIASPNIHLCKLYENYKKIIFYNITNFDQPFFDALYRADSVYYTSSKDLSQQSVELFGADLKIDSGEEVDFNSVKSILKNKHLSHNRMKQLLSQMSIDQSLFTEV